MKYKITLNGKTYEVEVEAGQAMLVDEYEAYAPAPAAAPGTRCRSCRCTRCRTGTRRCSRAAAVAAGEVVASPMPGNILSVNVSQGQAVKSGDILVILEAMKMENEILAPRDGTVAQVVTSKGAVVETGAPLVVLA